MFNDSAQTAPPVNNLLQPDIYNRLDAETIERTRVANTQLDQRLLTQQRILSKYRVAAERFHKRERERVQGELSRIHSKLPAARNIRDFRSKLLFGDPAFERRQKKVAAAAAARLRHGSDEDLPAEAADEGAGDSKGGGGGGGAGEEGGEDGGTSGLGGRRQRAVPWWDREELPFCERYFIHHLPTKRKFYKARTPSPLSHLPAGVTAAEGDPTPGAGTAADPSGLASSRHHGASRNAGLFEMEPAAGDSKDAPEEPLATDTEFTINELHLRDAGAPSGDERMASAGKDSNSAKSTSRKGRAAALLLEVTGSQTERSAGLLPPIGKHSLRLSQSSPQLYNGQ